MYSGSNEAGPSIVAVVLGVSNSSLLFLFGRNVATRDASQVLKFVKGKALASTSRRFFVPSSAGRFKSATSQQANKLFDCSMSNFSLFICGRTLPKHGAPYILTS